MAEARHLQVLSDYECFPVWRPGPSSVENVDPATLPVSEELAAALMGWAEEFDATLNREYHPTRASPWSGTGMPSCSGAGTWQAAWRASSGPVTG